MTKVGEVSTRVTSGKVHRGVGVPVWWTMRSTIMRPVAADMASLTATENRRIRLSQFVDDPGHNPAA